MRLKIRTEQHVEWFIDPPSQEDEEWHPEEGELDTQIDCTSSRQFRRDMGFAQKALQNGSEEEDLSRRVNGTNLTCERGCAYRRYRAIGSKTDEGQKYETEPSKMRVNQ